MHSLATSEIKLPPMQMAITVNNDNSGLVDTHKKTACYIALKELFAREAAFRPTVLRTLKLAGSNKWSSAEIVYENFVSAGLPLTEEFITELNTL